MEAKRVGHLALDADRLSDDIIKISGFHFDSQYEEYSLGGWQSCSLWNMNGDASDGTSYEYDGSAKITSYGAALSYVPEIVDGHFDLSKCKSVRVFAIRSGSLMQHRDYMEFATGFTRLHLVLKSTPHSYSSEESFVYQMQPGEIWFVDGRPVHSAANFSDDWRYHLILDFDPAFSPMELVRDVNREGAPPIRLIERPPLPDHWKELIKQVGRSANVVLLRQMIPIFARLHFFYAISGRDLFDWMLEIANACGDAEFINEVANMRQKFIGEV